MARKSGIFAGIIALILAFIEIIPLYPPNNIFLNCRIFSYENVNYYYWGYIEKNSSFTSITLPSPENLVALSVWMIILIVGILSIMGSTTKANLINSSKIYKINIVFLTFLLFIFGYIVVILVIPDYINIFYTLGEGYYLTILSLILNIIALKKIPKKGEE
ncbi:MAG: hypothetical protein ACTSQP_15605 [Promethearchaeota archaeon]